MFVLKGRLDGRQCFVSAQGQRQKCYVSLSLPLFFSHCRSFMYSWTGYSPVSNPLFQPTRLSLSLLSLSVVKPSSSGSAVKHHISLPAAINTSQVHMHTHSWECTGTHVLSVSHTHLVWLCTVCIEGLFFNNLQQKDLILLLSLKMMMTKVTKTLMSFNFFKN